MNPKHVIALWMVAQGLTAWPAAGATDMCEIDLALVGGPVTAGLYDGRHGAFRHMCPRTEAGLGGGGYIRVDRDNFYGHVRAAGDLYGSYELTRNAELFAALEVIRYQTVISSVSDSALGLGHTTLGATYRAVHGERYAAGITGQAVLPTATGLYGNIAPFAFDLGLLGEYALRYCLRVHGQAGGLASFADSSGPALWRFGVNLNAGITWQPVTFFAWALDVSSLFFYFEPLTAFSVSTELRFAIGRHARASLGAMRPLAGQEEAEVVARLNLGWEF